MSAATLQFFLNIASIVGLFFALYGLYFLGYALFSLKKEKSLPHTAPSVRFAIVIAARNEEKVISRLIDSLNEQEYLRELFDVYSAVNNCTDNTEKISLEHGAFILKPRGETHTKGDVLFYAIEDVLEKDKYDAVCVIDADNLAHPQFLQKMNDAYNSGQRVAQGFRSSKNPADGPVPTCYSILYWMLNRFYNAGHQNAGVSAIVHGSGFMAATSLLKQMGGWNTSTMTEDYEFSAQCVLQGERVRYVYDAIVYDEQPHTFKQSWKQRRRWSTGSVQGMKKYTMSLFKYSFKNKSFTAADMALTFARPIIQMISLVIGATALVLRFYGMLEIYNIPFSNIILALLGLLLLAYIACCAWAAIMVRSNLGKIKRGTIKGIAFFAIFMLSYVPIMVISMFKYQKTWDTIYHKRAWSLNQIT